MKAIDQIQHKSLAELAKASGTELLSLQAAVQTELTRVKAIKDWIEAALRLKYEEQAQTLRLQADKDSGTVQFTDEEIQVVSTLPKKITWDQSRLAQMAQRLASGGEDPSEYIEVSYRVSERKYQSWPEALRQSFDAARTFTPGKPTFKLLAVNAKEGANA